MPRRRCSLSSLRDDTAEKKCDVYPGSGPSWRGKTPTSCLGVLHCLESLQYKGASGARGGCQWLWLTKVEEELGLLRSRLGLPWHEGPGHLTKRCPSYSEDNNYCGHAPLSGTGHSPHACALFPRTALVSGMVETYHIAPAAQGAASLKLKSHRPSWAVVGAAEVRGAALGDVRRADRKSVV